MSSDVLHRQQRDEELDSTLCYKQPARRILWRLLHLPRACLQHQLHWFCQASLGKIPHARLHRTLLQALLHAPENLKQTSDHHVLLLFPTKICTPSSCLWWVSRFKKKSIWNSGNLKMHFRFWLQADFRLCLQLDSANIIFSFGELARFLVPFDPILSSPHFASCRFGRFSQLINPCMHLQRSLQQSLATLRFWLNVDRAVKVYNRSLGRWFGLLLGSWRWVFREPQGLTWKKLLGGVFHFAQSEARLVSTSFVWSKWQVSWSWCKDKLEP